MSQRLFPHRQNRIAWVCLAALMLGPLMNGCDGRETRKRSIGILCGLDVFATTVDGFLSRMAELGYVEGRHVAYDLQRTNFDSVVEERILRKFVADRVDVMLVFPSEVAVAAKAATRGTDIPVVFCQTNIEGTGLVGSIAEPGGNITGVRYPGPDLALKRFEILHELAPGAGRMWVPYAKNVLIVSSQLEALRPAAAEAGVTLVESPAENGSELLADLERRSMATDIGIEAILFISEPLARTPAVFPKIGEFAARHRIPIGGVLYSLEGYSTLFGVATDNLEVGKLAAQQVHKVLQGTPPGTIPVVSAESFFQINTRVAQELGLIIPEGLLKQANEVVR
jgi:putative ABC transport system substrate-binding protein